MMVSNPTIPLRPEAQLLLCCARTHLEPGHALRLERLLGERLDWNDILQTASRHGVMPLLYRHLSQVCPETVPAGVLERLRSQFQAHVGRTLFLTGELLALLKLLESHQIPAIPYKGPALAAALYGDPTLRQFSDLDLLVRRQDILQIKPLLLAQGYQPQFQMTERQEASWLQSQYEYNFDHPGSQLHLELHWQVVPQYFSQAFKVEQTWTRLETVTLAGAPVPHLAAEDLLLALCLHGTRHCWQQLNWICDVAELVRRQPALDWERLLAGVGPAQRELYLGLRLAYELLDAPLPPGVLARLQADPVVTALATWVMKQLFREVERPFESIIFHLRLRPSWPARIQYALRLAMNLNPLDEALLPLPPALIFLYYLARPLRLVGEYGLRPLKGQLHLGK